MSPYLKLMLSCFVILVLLEVVLNPGVLYLPFVD